MWKGNTEFNRKCGEILEISLNVEHSLEYFISAYCGYCGCYEEIIHEMHVLYPTLISKENIHKIQHLIQPRLDFKEKIEIFKEICNVEKVNKKEYRSILKKIEQIQSIRNKVAHGERYSSISLETKIINNRRKFLTIEENFNRIFQENEMDIKLTDELIKELEKNQDNIVDYNCQLMNKIIKQHEVESVKINSE